MKTARKESLFSHDLSIIVLSILIAVLLVKTNILSDILNSASGVNTFGSLIAGMFFTSVFTTAPAVVTLGEIAHNNSIFLTAFWGAIGAVIGDLIIFQFIRDELSEHLVIILKHNSLWKRVRVLFKLKYFRWLTFMLGGLILASPFPDELAVSLLGFAKMKNSTFVLISLAFNFLGILLIGIVAKSL
jgi:hypothetical protein